MKILIHTPVSNRAWVLPEFLDALSAQVVMPTIDVEYRFDINDTHDESRVILNAAYLPGPKSIVDHPWAALHLPDHAWNAERYSRMIILRNNALAQAKALGAHYLFSIDSDVILKDSDTLQHLISADVPVIAGVFMARWGNPEATALPNVWQSGQNEMSDEFLEGIEKSPDHLDVGGLGACTLIRRDVWEAGVNYSAIPRLSALYRGEDRYFSIRAAVSGFPLVACSHKRIEHRERTK